MFFLRTKYIVGFFFIIFFVSYKNEYCHFFFFQISFGPLNTVLVLSTPGEVSPSAPFPALSMDHDGACAQPAGHTDMSSAPVGSPPSPAVSVGNLPHDPPPSVSQSYVPLEPSAPSFQNNNSATVHVNPSLSLLNSSNNPQPVTLESLSGDIRQLTAVVFQMNAKLNHLSTNVHSLSANVQDLRVQMAGLQRDSTTNAQAIATIEARMSNIETNMKPSAVVTEVADRLKRALNVIFYNVPEDNTNDFDKIANILARFQDVNLTGVEIWRIGSRNMSDHRATQHRPLVLRMLTQKDALSVLKQRDRLLHEISVSSDRTQSEREAIRAVKLAVDVHNSQNPNNQMRLKFIKNEPAMVPVDPVLPESKRRKNA